MSERLKQVRNAVTLILRSYLHAETPDEREAIAMEIGRLDTGGARASLTEMARKAMKR